MNSDGHVKDEDETAAASDEVGQNDADTGKAPEKPLEPDEAAPMIIVGIGASAGGLEALKMLISALPASENICYVVAQHLSPTHNSLLTELLAPVTKLSVRDLRDGQELVPNCIFITPPDRDVEYADGALHLSPPKPGVGPKPSVDRLLTSLADNAGDHSVAIILSGTGSDGALGVRAVKAAGGVVLVQSPDDAKYDGMPRSAIQTGCADLVMAPDAMGETLENIAGAAGKLILPSADDGISDSYKRVVALVKRAAGMDLANYKSTTIERRILRRMRMRSIDDMDAYAGLLQRDPQEAEMLSRDVLISVTSFFRDDVHFESLRQTLSQLVESREAEEMIRVWVPGCATGEEAYSIAISLAEIVRDQPEAPDFLIFASDIDEAALNVARAGNYADSSLDDMPEDLRARYFHRQAGLWVVKKHLRQSIVFASQNVIEDPPFSRMDLVSCRNVLIYFNRDVQRRVLELFHYALRDFGLLFLGRSESIEPYMNLFEPLSKRDRVFRRRSGEVDYAVPLKRTSPTAKQSASAYEGDYSERRTTRNTQLTRALLNRYCPPCVVVDAQDRVIHTAGEVSKFLTFPDGELDTGVFQLVPESSRPELRALLHRVRREDKPAVGSRIAVEGEEQDVRLTVYPLRMDRDSLVVVAFERTESVAVLASDTAEDNPREFRIASELERELANTRMHLQTVVEELETSNEELQSQSEELQSSNEELQSTNEELQTSNEELQSTNEELTTVNDELQSKSSELEDLASTLISVKESLQSPLMLVDRRLQVLDANPACEQVMAVPHGQISYNLTAVAWELEDTPSLITALRKVVSTGVGQELIMTTVPDGGKPRSYLVMAAPKLNTRGELEGAVVSMTDISRQVNAETSLKDTMSDLARERDRIQITLQSIGDGVITTDANAVIQYMNPKASELTGWAAEDALGKPLDAVYQAISGTTVTDTPASIVARCLESGEGMISQEADPVVVGRSGRRIVVAESAAPLHHDGKIVGAVLVFRDVTDERLLSQELSFRASHDALTHLANRYEFERQVLAAMRTRHGESDPNREHALMYIDLDNFKVVNDTCGHTGGDAMLKQVATELKGVLRASDLLARLGGDEFGALLRNCSLAKAEDIAAQLLDALRAYKFTYNRRNFTVTASIGVLAFSSRDDSVATVLSRVDAAAYAAKEAGKDRVYVATDDDAKMAEQHGDMEWVGHLTDALERDRFVLHYEDVYGLIDGCTSAKPVYRELLIRMLDEDDNLLAPANFVSAAERYQLIVPLDTWVFETAMTHLRQTKDDGVIHAINVSGQSLSDERFRDSVETCLGQAPELAARLCFEITETAAISRLSDVAPFVNRLKSFGTRVALDDFGTGMASFAYLKNLPVDYLKIDGGFVSNALNDNIDRAMIEAICKVGHEVGITTIAEHVSNDALRQAMGELGVDCVQGFLFGRGAPLTDLRIDDVAAE